MSACLHASPALAMLSFVLSRGFCLTAAQLSGRTHPTFGSLSRPFTSSTPTRGETSESGPVVTYSQLKTMLSNGDIQLFDVRNPDEHLAGRIPDAVNIPLGTLEESLKLPPEHFQQIFQVKAPGKDDDNIVFHCKTGVRSSRALDIALKLGFHRARHYKGGYTEWAEQEGKGA
ncbi:thiosulfate:glutathione sulfurtransferase [Spinachia spinachia]